MSGFWNICARDEGVKPSKAAVSHPWMSRGQNTDENIQTPERCFHSVPIKLRKGHNDFVKLDVSVVVTFWERLDWEETGEKFGAAINGLFLDLGCDYAEVSAL